MDELSDNNPKATQEVYAGIEEPKTPEVETQPTIPDDEEAQTSAPASDGDSGDSSHSAKARILEQTRKVKELEATVDDLTGISALGNPILPRLDLKPGEEITPEKYEEHVTAKANALVDLKIAANNNASRIKSELRDAISDYPVLNPKKSEDFDEEISDSISEATKAFIRSNPTGNVKAFVDKMMSPYKKSLDKKVAQETARTQETIAKQASQTALRPTQTTQVSKDFKELSIAEMEKKLGKVY